MSAKPSRRTMLRTAGLAADGMRVSGSRVDAAARPCREPPATLPKIYGTPSDPALKKEYEEIPETAARGNPEDV